MFIWFLAWCLTLGRDCFIGFSVFIAFAMSVASAVRVEVNHQKQSLMISYQGEQVRRLHEERSASIPNHLSYGQYSWLITINRG